MSAICAYFKYNSKTMGCLQLYYTPNDSFTTKDALFHVKSYCNLQAMALCKHRCFVIGCASMNDNKIQGAYDRIIIQ